MTLKQIHEMFAVGQEWDAVNTLIEKASGRRVLVQKLVTQLVWKTPLADRNWMAFPKAAQVVEARDGFLQFRLFSLTDPHAADRAHHTLTLIKVAA